MMAPLSEEHLARLFGDVHADMTHFMLCGALVESAVDDAPFDRPAADDETLLAVWDKERAA